MKRLIFIALLGLAALYVDWPQVPGSYIPEGSALPGNPGLHIGSFVRQGAKLGLDLQGGTQITLQADLSGVPSDQQSGAMEGVLNVITRRIDAYGVSEAAVQQLGDNRVIVQLPGVKDVAQAEQLIGQTAKLEFEEQNAQGQWVPAMGTYNGQEVELTGAFLVPGGQQVSFQSQAGTPEVAFSFNDEGSQLFGQLTQQLLGKPLGIFLDGQLISSPTVQAVITSNGVITGLTLDQAHLLAIQLNAGALPVPVSIQQEQTVDASLGADSVQRSVVAGELGMLVVVLFMLLYYRLPGVAASLALCVYALVTLALFKLIPITLTLAGVAGFILSVGMAVDANILIFERMKEELRSGQTLRAAIRGGEQRAWPSIRDSNMSTLLTCAVLYGFGQAFGATIVMGFALVLAVGVIVSLFSAIFVTRALLEAILSLPWAHNPRLFGMEIPADAQPQLSAPRRRREFSRVNP